MKKSILFLSVLGAAVAAQAQSSLTLAGTADATFTRVTGSLTSRTGVNSGGNSTSKLIMRGVEDLGGGLYANFWLESGFNLDSGTGTTTNTNNQPSGGAPTAPAPGGSQGLTFNRRAIVGFGGPWGEIHAGREWSPTYDTFTSRYDVFGVGVGIGLNYTASLNSALVRVSNDIAYSTPKFFGFVGNIQHWAGENPSGTATHDDGSGDGARISYENGPFTLLGSFARTKFAAGDAIQRNAAGSYDAGQFKLTFNYNHDQQGLLKQQGFLVGGIWRVGVGEIKASYSQIENKLGAANPEGKKFALGYVHNLSKRTALYTTVARINNSDGGTFAIAGSTTAANQHSTGFDLGLRHNF